MLFIPLTVVVVLVAVFPWPLINTLVVLRLRLFPGRLKKFASWPLIRLMNGAELDAESQ